MNPDFKDLLAAFSGHSVEYLVVGAHALAVHGHVRATKDLDIWVRPKRENAKNTLAALVEYGAPLHDLSIDDLSSVGLMFQIGLPPVRIDIMTTIDGVEFEPAWMNRVMVNVDEVAVPVLSRSDIILNKRAAGRLQDLADVERLEQMSQED